MRAALVMIALLSAAGCTAVGPASIQAGRLTYTEAINETDAQQTLLHIVRNRYDETATLLGVSGVAASISVSSNMTINLPFGKPAYYTGSLVPFSGTLNLEESPTISYTPVQGRLYMAQLMSPIPLEVLVPLARTAHDLTPLLTLLVSRINDISNPVFLPSPAAQPDPRFLRVAELIGQLRAVGRLSWTSEAGEAAGYSIVIRRYAPAYAQEVRELLDLLGAPQPKDATQPVVLPVVLAIEAPESGGISLETRSVFELAQLLGGAIELPEDHVKKGLVLASPPMGWAGSALRIRSANARPEGASVAVQYRGLWYYIDDADRPTKQAFRFVHALFSMVVGEAIKGTAGAPVLTVPVK